MTDQTYELKWAIRKVIDGIEKARTYQENVVNVHVRLNNKGLITSINAAEEARALETLTNKKLIREIARNKDFVDYEVSPKIYELAEHLEYEEQGRKQRDQKRFEAKSRIDEVIYWIEIRKHSIILVGNDFEVQIKGLRHESSPDLIFDYIYKHANERLTLEKVKADVETQTGIEIDFPKKGFPDLIDKLGFVGDLRKIFFDASYDSVFFRRSVTKGHLNQIGIRKLNLNTVRISKKENEAEE